LASLLERMGRVQDAVAEYREYARLAPTSADARQLADRADRLARQAGGGT
jgi:predicted RNA polymerase sigma factor